MWEKPPNTIQHTSLAGYGNTLNQCIVDYLLLRWKTLENDHIAGFPGSCLDLWQLAVYIIYSSRTGHSWGLGTCSVLWYQRYPGPLCLGLDQFSLKSFSKKYVANINIYWIMTNLPLGMSPNHPICPTLTCQLHRLPSNLFFCNLLPQLSTMNLVLCVKRRFHLKQLVPEEALQGKWVIDLL